MKKLLAYLVSGIATFIMCWCFLCSCITDPGSERAPWAFGTAICFLIALLSAGIGNSLKWDGTKSDEDNE